jgi:hypothetical protein
MMGLLSSDGGLKGLLARPDFGDALAQAQAFLGGDYGMGIDVAARRFRRRRRDKSLLETKDPNDASAEAVAFSPPTSWLPAGTPDPYASIRRYIDIWR